MPSTAKTSIVNQPIKKTFEQPGVVMRTHRIWQDAISLLKDDHARVKAMFEKYEQCKTRYSPGQKKELVTQICGELTVHIQIEEEIFYPAVRQAIEDFEELDHLLNEALVEHGCVKQMIAQLEGASPDEPLYDARVTVLGEYVKHHAGEEESDIFPKMKRAKRLDLDEIGEELAARSKLLKSELDLN